MIAGKDVCLRRLAKGVRAREVRFNRFLGNAKVTAKPPDKARAADDTSNQINLFLFLTGVNAASDIAPTRKRLARARMPGIIYLEGRMN